MYANPQAFTTSWTYICPGCQQSLLPRFPGDQLVACPRCQKTFNPLHPAQSLPVQFWPQWGYPFQLQQQALGPQRPWISQQALAPQQAIAVQNAIGQQQYSPATRKQQEALLQAEIRQMAGFMCHQQQALLQRVNTLEKWKSQVEAHMSSGGAPGADSDHSGQSQAESQQQNLAVQSAQQDRVSDVAQTDHVAHVPRATQAHHQGEENQVSQRVPHIIGSRNRHNPTAFERPVRITIRKTRTKQFSQHRAMVDRNRRKQMAFRKEFSSRNSSVQP
ncbi:hypothetical protein ABHI18_004544 [Aspergillus niger]